MRVYYDLIWNIIGLSSAIDIDCRTDSDLMLLASSFRADVLNYLYLEPRIGTSFFSGGLVGRQQRLRRPWQSPLQASRRSLLRFGKVYLCRGDGTHILP